MKKRNSLNRLAVLFAAAMVSVGTQTVSAAKKETAGSSSTVVYKAVPEQSNVKWLGKKVTGAHDGTIGLKSGEIQTVQNVVVGGSFVIDMTSIKVADITDPESNGNLVGHLASDDFFSTAKNPTATFVVTKVTRITSAKAEQPNYTLDGNLTIKGISHPASFPALINIAGDTLTASAQQIKIDRTKYDIRYGSKQFFKSIGDKAIYDDFFIDVTMVAKKS